MRTEIAIISALTLVLSMPLAFGEIVETKGQNYDLVENFFIGEAVWESHPERIMDGGWQNYALSNTGDKVIFNTNAVGSFVFDKNSCSYSIYGNGFDGEQIIPSVSAVATYLNNGQWQNLPINDEVCTVTVDRYEDGVFLTSTKVITEDITEDVFIPYTGTTENFYVNATNANFDLIQSSNGTNTGYFNGETITTTGIETSKFSQEIRLDIIHGFKETFKIWHDGDEQLGVSQTVHTGESITIADQTINIAELNGQSFDRQYLEDNQAQIFEIADSLNYDFDTGFESLSNVNIIFDGDYKVNMDFSEGNFVGYLEIDPTFSATGSVNGGNWDFDLSSLNSVDNGVTGGTLEGGTLTTSQISDISSNLGGTWSTSTISESYKVHKFTSTGSSTFTVTAGGGTVSSLIVGGGGGGAGSGGGGGGVLQSSSTVTATSYPVTVGAGHGGGASSPSAWTTGGDSSFNGMTAGGGGSGGYSGSSTQIQVAGSNGDGTGGVVDGDQGRQGINGGGSSGGQNGGQNSLYGGGGANGDGSEITAGRGGFGIYSDITGTAVSYGDGGGAGKFYFKSTGGNGNGGFGGGDQCPTISTPTYSYPVTAGTPNTGGGGGGSWICSGQGGGSGIVVVRYVDDGSITATGGTVTSLTNFQSAYPTLSLNWEVPTVPQPPTNLSTVTGIPIELDWDSPTDTGNTAITGYKVYRTLNEFALSELPDNSANSAGIDFTNNEFLTHGFETVNSVPLVLDDDFTSYTSDSNAETSYPTGDNTSIKVDTSTDKIEYTFTRNPLIQTYLNHDITGSAVEDNWVLRIHELVATTKTGGVTSFIGLSNSDTALTTTSQNFAGLEWGSNTGNHGYSTEAVYNSAITRGAEATTLTVGTTYYAEVIKSGTTVTTNIYSDSGFSTLVHSSSSTFSSNPTDLRYFKITSDTPAGSNEVIETEISKIEFYNGVSDTTSTIPVTVFEDKSTNSISITSTSGDTENTDTCVPFTSSSGAMSYSNCTVTKTGSAGWNALVYDPTPFSPSDGMVIEWVSDGQNQMFGFQDSVPNASSTLYPNWDYVVYCGATTCTHYYGSTHTGTNTQTTGYNYMYTSVGDIIRLEMTTDGYVNTYHNGVLHGTYGGANAPSQATASQYYVNAIKYASGSYDSAYFVETVPDPTPTSSVTGVIGTGVQNPDLSFTDSNLPDGTDNFSIGSWVKGTAPYNTPDNIVIDWNGQGDNSEHYAKVDLGSALSDTNWVLRFTNEITAISTSSFSAGNWMVIGLGDSSNISARNTGQDFIGTVFRDDGGAGSNGDDVWSISSDGSTDVIYDATKTQSTGTYASGLSVGTHNVEIIRTSATAFTVNMYNSDWSSIVDTISGTANSNTDGLRYFTVDTSQDFGTGSPAFTGQVTNVQVWNGATSATGTTESFDSLGTPLGSRVTFGSGNALGSPVTPSTELLKLNDVTFNVGTTSASVVKLATAPSYTTDFGTSTGWTVTDSDITIDTSNNRIHYDGQLDNTNTQAYYDYLTNQGSNLSEFTIEIDITKLGNSNLSHRTEFLITDSLGGVGVSQNAIGITTQANGNMGCRYYDNNSNYDLGTFSISNGNTRYIELSYDGTTFTCNLMDSSRTSVTSSHSQALSGVDMSNARYILIGDRVTNSPTNAVEVEYENLAVTPTNIMESTIISVTGLADNTSEAKNYVFTRDGNNWAIYQNGVSQATATDSTSLGANTGQDYTTHIDGMIDEMFINSDVLTSTEVDNIYDRGVAPTQIATTGSTTTDYDDSSVTGGNEYYYTVKATNAIGDSDFLTPFVSALAGTPPDVPTSVSSTINSPNTAPLDITVSWSAPTNVGTGTLTGFEIYRDSTLITTTGLVSSYTDTVPTGGGTFEYKLKAVSTHGTSGFSSTTSTTTPTVPPAPTNAPALAINNPNPSPLDIEVSWTEPASGGSIIQSYEVFRSADDVTYTSVGTVTDLDFTDTVPSAGTWYYKFTSINLVGSSGLSPSNSITTASVPSSPLNASSVIPSINSAPYDVTVSWDLPTSTGGSALTGYNVYRQTGTGAFSLVTTTTALGYVDTVPTALNQDYTFKIHAVNNVGESTTFTTTTITTGDVPDAPTLSFTTGTTALSWTVPNSDASITGYEIFRDSSLLTTVTTTSHSDFTPINFGQSYQYEVQAVSSLGNSVDSNSIVTTPETEITGMIVQGITGTGAVIDWNEPAYYQGQITSYSVYYATPATSANPAISAGTTTNTYSNFAPTLDYDTSYTFGVTINSPLGNSGFSNLVNATTGVDNSIVAYDPNTGGMNWFDIDSVSEQTVNVIEFQRETQNLNVNGTFTDVDTLQVGYPSWWDSMTCNVDYKFAQKTEQYVEGTDMTAVVNSADANQQVIGFQFQDIDNEVIEVECAPQQSQQDDGVSAKYIMTQTNLSTGMPNIPLVTQIQAFQTGDYGTDGEFGALDVVGLFVILISMVGFNRLSPIVGVLLSASLVFGLSFFGIISLPTVLVGIIALVIFLAWGITRNR